MDKNEIASFYALCFYYYYYRLLQKKLKQNLQTQKNLIGHPSFANLHYQTVLSEGSCLEGVEML